MSRLWNKPRLRVYVGDDHLVMCQLGGRWRPQVIHKEKIRFESGQTSRALEALEAWLIAHPLQADIECVLGAAHVRYLLLPWDAQLVDTEFRQTLAHALFARNFQDEPARHEARFSPARYGQPQLAAFVEKELLTSLDFLARKFNGRLTSVEPLLVSVWNRFRRKLEKEQGSLLIAESGRLLALRHDHGAFTDVQWRPYADEELFGRLKQLSEAAPARIFAPLHGELAMSLPASWLALESAEGFSSLRDGEYASALCGVC
ncbi:MAG: hypothetical protein PSX71_03635 [bacterium]|nr:hypothetical protein [bacterium]